jgi:hypothetical protein
LGGVADQLFRGDLECDDDSRLVELARTVVDEFDPERRLPGAGRAGDHDHVPAWNAAEQDVIEPANPGLDEIISLRHEPPPPFLSSFPDPIGNRCYSIRP